MFGKWVSRASLAFVVALESALYWHGKRVASHPWIYLVGCFVTTVLCSLGFLNFYIENDPMKLWIPQEADYMTTLLWQKENFPQDQRREFIMYEAENVLKADHIKDMFQIHNEIRNIRIIDQYGRNRTQEDLCFRVPSLGGYEEELYQLRKQMLRGRDPNEEIEWSIELNKNAYNEFYKSIPRSCLELGILEIWGYNETLIESLTDDDVIHGINTAQMSATFAFPLDFEIFIGGTTKNETGHVTGATSALTMVVMAVNRSDFDDVVRNAAGMGEQVDLLLYEWEGQFIKFLKNYSSPSELQIFPQAQRSFSELSEETVNSDVKYLVTGNIALFIYVQLMLGGFSLVDTRPALSFLGLLTIYMAIGAAFGLCSAFRLSFTPLHTFLPLLLLGLGVDDMFVIAQAWNNLSPEDQTQNLKERIGRALRHAGVAITVTSVTDFAAFLIGSTTVLPALRSFCIYSSIGITMLYLFLATFFVASFTLDQIRLEDKRNGLFWCYKHKNWTPNKYAKFSLCQTVIDKVYSKVLLLKPVKALVILLTLGMLGTSIWGVTTLRKEFNPVWFIPSTSYLYKFMTRLQLYYPQIGELGTVYVGALDYPEELPKVGDLMTQLERSDYVSSVDSWYDLLVNYTRRDSGEDIEGKVVNETFFRDIMSTFLYSPTGSRFQSYFHFGGNLTIGEPTPPVLACKFDFYHRFLDYKEQIPAMDEVKRIVSDSGLSDFAGAVSFQYGSWETEKIITMELIRNLSLAMVAVFTVTLLLISDFLTSLYVLICVIFTLVEVAALMSWWGLTIDIISCVNLVLAVGLCVDYSVHIGLHFMQVKGTRDERVRLTVREIGPPVLNGAFSTFLVFSLLGGSESHVFESFFKIFFGVFIFGVYHGIVFLPVLLSLIGPAPYKTDNSFPQEPDALDHYVPATSPEKTQETIQNEGVTYQQVSTDEVMS